MLYFPELFILSCAVATLVGVSFGFYLKDDLEKILKTEGGSFLSMAFKVAKVRPIAGKIYLGLWLYIAAAAIVLFLIRLKVAWG